MEILIIGGSRFLGPILIEQLLKNGHSLSVFNRGTIKSEYTSGVHFIKGDRNGSFNIDDHFDVVIDTCAYTGIHTKKTLDDLDFDFFLHIGTVASYKRTELFPLTESSEIGEWPLWGDYNKGKVECENVLEKSGVKYASLRPVYILGPNNYVDREHFIYSCIKRGVPLRLPGNGQALVQFVFCKDVVDSIVLIAENKDIGAFNCAGDEVITLIGLVQSMGKIAGKSPKIEFNPEADGVHFDESEFPFANENMVCSNEKIKKAGIGFTPLITGLKADYQHHYKKSI